MKSDSPFLAENGVSVIICCYNSSAVLRPTLLHLAHQQSKKPWELILVNNASTDHTANFAIQLWEELGEPATLKVVEQPVPGLSNARKMGIEHARFKYIVFCDDDNWLQQDYLDRVYVLLESRMNCGIIGAAIEGATDGQFPDWFPQYEGGYAIGTPYLKETDVTKQGVWGAGMSGRKEVFQKVIAGSFPLLCSGRKSGQLTSGEDTEICLRAALLGYRILYHPELKLTHYISRKRLTTEYRDKLFEGFKQSNAILDSYRRCLHITNMKRVKQYIFWGRSLCLYLAGIIFKDSRRMTYQLDYLYFISGWSIFKTDLNKKIHNWKGIY